MALLSLACRVWLSAALPMTGDEALFYWWARFLDYGYYDHPPMVGWWLAAVRALLGDAVWALRLPSVLLPLGVGAAIWWAWAPVSRSRAAWAVLLYWLMPVNWLNSLITTDTPLILWSAWAVAAVVRAEQVAMRAVASSQGGDGATGWLKAAGGWYALSGVFLGLAFLSKYFVALLGVALAAYFLLAARKRWLGLVLMVLCALPAVALNLHWNLTHCWTNIMFNVFNRNEDAVFAWGNVGTYVGMMVYLISPVVLWQAWRHRGAVWRTARVHALLSCVALVPLLLFGLMSGKKVIGLHWVLGFYPFVFVLLALCLPSDRLPGARKGLVVFLAVHLLAVFAVAQTSLPQWHKVKYYNRLVEALRAEQIVQQVRVPGVVLMSNGYSSSSILGYAAREHMPVFGLGSFHARQDDLIVDHARYEGQTLRIIRQSRPDLAEYAPYFDSVRLLSYAQDGQPFYAVEGVNFHYAAYRDGVMAEVNRRYYRFPSWLPVWQCSFCQRLCGAARCAP
ncbi:glycosyltransferase family 39 protein [Aquabacterium sp.]|uniref:ArnT family glycosyltransferase n=1 Tax=Aquabacterium sp. TaxID=1872578 RepID=UPI0025C0AAD3|nr:glycosyltransferase family 39 protein [Aquabacterium sp.]